jgi:hypothetical protein
MDILKVAFCITCKGRAHHLKETLPANLERAHLAPFISTIIILDYNSQDDLGQWLKDEYAGEICVKTVQYFQETTASGFHMSKAKNLAHRAALETGSILVNLDADNLLTWDYIDVLDKAFTFRAGADILHCNQPGVRGVSGRIALKPSVFHQLGGYNESFEPYGYEDIDLLERARGAGFKVVETDTGMCLDHSDGERVRNLGNDNPDWIHTLNNRNKFQSELDIKCKRYVANRTGWGEATLIKNFKEKLVWEAIIP